MRRIIPRSTLFPYTTLFRSLVNQLLDFQKVDDNSRKLIVQHTDIVPVINEIGLKYKESSLNKPYHFEVSLQEESMVLYFDADVVSTILDNIRSEEHTSELQSRENLVCR